VRAYFTFGLANDQLGYLIAPASEYPWITYSNPGNDTADPNPYGPGAVQPECAPLTASDSVPMGPAPQQPWRFGDGTALPSPFPQ
jgi:hypothetical protein